MGDAERIATLERTLADTRRELEAAQRREGEVREALAVALGRAKAVRWSETYRAWVCDFCSKAARGPGEIEHSPTCPEAVFERLRALTSPAPSGEAGGTEPDAAAQPEGRGGPVRFDAANPADQYRAWWDAADEADRASTRSAFIGGFRAARPAEAGEPVAWRLELREPDGSLIDKPQFVTDASWARAFHGYVAPNGSRVAVPLYEHPPQPAGTGDGAVREGAEP